MIDLQQENAELHVLADDWRQIALDAQLQLATATDALKAIAGPRLLPTVGYLGIATDADIAQAALETIERLKAGAS